jgi:hypothetical protein
LAKATDQFRASDVTVWGIVALSIWAVAVLGANVSAVVPAGVYAAMHASRLEGSTLNQLRTQVAALEDQAAKIEQASSLMQQRFAMSEEASGDVTRRVGALEVSLPRIVEAQSAMSQPVDTTTTGSIDDGKTLTFEVDGGSVSVQQRPLFAGSGDVTFRAIPQPERPPMVASSDPAMGIAIGFPLNPGEAEASWQQTLSDLGTALSGLSPVLGAKEDGDRQRLIAGPVTDKATAVNLCARIAAVGIPCEPVPYAGEPVPLLN